MIHQYNPNSWCEFVAWQHENGLLTIKRELLLKDVADMVKAFRAGKPFTFEQTQRADDDFSIEEQLDDVITQHFENLRTEVKSIIPANVLTKRPYCADDEQTDE